MWQAGAKQGRRVAAGSLWMVPAHSTPSSHMQHTVPCLKQQALAWSMAHSLSSFCARAECPDRLRAAAAATRPATESLPSRCRGRGGWWGGHGLVGRLH